jgi:2-polyprenyl-6-methoxyphenol hydroxylase-like FAD-dependent oxidoreductase
MIGRFPGRDGEPTYGYSIRREVLDPMLRRLAAQTPGVEIMPGVTATGLSSDRGRVTGLVARARDGAERRIRCGLVVGADGRGSKVAELAGVRARTTPNRRVMYFAYFRGVRFAAGNAGRMWFLEPDVAYLYPNDQDLTVAACCVDRRRLPAFRARLEEEFLGVFDGLADGPSLRDAERVSPIIGKLDLPNVRRRAAMPGLALVGDAALAADPLWAVGCGWALQSAEWLADVVAAESDLDRALARYRRRHRSRLLAHHVVSSSYSSGRAFLPHERLFLKAGPRDARTASRVAGFGERLLGVSDLLSPRSVGRALWVLTRRGYASDGLRDAQGRAASSCAASETSVVSALGRPTSCAASGSPSSSKPAGTEAAGWPV